MNRMNQNYDIPKRTALNHLKRFAGLGLLRRIGTGPWTKYEIIGS